MEKNEIELLIRKLEQLNSEAHTQKFYSEKGKYKKERADAERNLGYVIDELKFLINKHQLFELVYGENRAPQEISEYFMTLTKYFKDDIRDIITKLKEKLDAAK